MILCNKEQWNNPKETEFIVKNLLSLSYPEGFGLEPKPRMTPYHQVFLSPNEEGGEKRGEDFPSLSDGTFYLLFLLGAGHRRIVVTARVAFFSLFFPR